MRPNDQADSLGVNPKLTLELDKHLTLDEAAARYARANAKVQTLTESYEQATHRANELFAQTQAAREELNLAHGALLEAAQAAG